ncbi:MAG: response regulator [Synechococcales cyanobacterium M58_A2018_015]|nr:response regulator [Synechococcales cyanobacterium M58_A2018_015]
MKILVVEDDNLTASALATVLGNQTYTVEIATDGASAWELIETFPYDLVLLDIALPKLDGISLCRQIRSHHYQMPILLLTAHDSSHDKAVGLDAGADDYVVKPFDPEELVARIRALLRRGQATAQAVLTWEQLQLDPHSCEVSYRGQILALTPKEYALLELFLRNPRRVFSCSAILENLWSFEDIPGEEAVRTHIKGLRQKLKAAGAPTDCIETVYGIGYRLKPASSPPQRHSGQARDAGSKCAHLGAEAPASSSAEQTLAAIADVWDRFKPRILEQVAVLEQAATAISSQTLTEDLRQQAQQQSHSLAGSLGTFGLETGSQMARSINQLLHRSGWSAAEGQRLRQLVAVLRQTISQAPAALKKSPSVLSTATAPAGDPADERPLLLLIDSNPSTAAALIAEATHWGLRTELATHLAMAQARLSQLCPQVVLLNACSVDRSGLSDLRRQLPTVPLLVRLLEPAVPLDCQDLAPCVCLPPLSTPAQVLKDVMQQLHQANSIAAKTDATIMVVDDDPHLLAVVRVLLQPWGLHAVTLDDPTRFWQTLEAAAPDLLVLDLKMTPINGIDLCRQVRQNPDWSSLPILILTSCRDARTISQVFAAGADDFVSKPIVGPEFVTRIMHRLERVRLLSNLSEIDRLTQVSTRPKATLDLYKLLRLAQRQGQGLSLMLIQVEPMPALHSPGSAVLRQVGCGLRHGVREEDVVARWSETEFVLGLYGMPKDGQNRLQALLSVLQQDLIATGFEPVTFRMGVAHYPDDGENLPALYQSALQQSIVLADSLADNLAEQPCDQHSAYHSCANKSDFCKSTSAI